MRCFACDRVVTDGYDKKTDRWYCFECFSATNDVLVKQLDDEMEALFGFGKDTYQLIEEWGSDTGNLEVPKENERQFDYE
jgi:DNA-directed RNA polymerase subunit N (RpoN/RPB10)